jgi:hypothetical protein
MTVTPLLCNGQTTTTTTNINNNNLSTSTTNTLINTNYFKHSNKTQINKSINKGILDSGAQNTILTINTCLNNDLPIKQNQNKQNTIKWGNGNNKTKTNLVGAY